MSYQDLMGWISANPFTPFRLHATDERHFDIQAASMIWPGRYTTMIGLADRPDEPDVPARHMTLVNLHIVSAEPLPAAATA